jgi:selenide,water dikinase
VLGKPLGVGVLSAALKKNALDEAGYRAMIENTTKLNKPGQVLATMTGVHALTDITGFGLLGHTLELARGAKLRAKISMGRVPLLPGVAELAESGFITGASGRNWAGYGHEISLSPNVSAAQQMLLTDPQTSGGLLVSCAPDAVADVIALFREHGFAHAAEIGEMIAGQAGIEVTP